MFLLSNNTSSEETASLKKSKTIWSTQSLVKGLQEVHLVPQVKTITSPNPDVHNMEQQTLIDHLKIRYDDPKSKSQKIIPNPKFSNLKSRFDAKSERFDPIHETDLKI